MTHGSKSSSPATQNYQVILRSEYTFFFREGNHRAASSAAGAAAVEQPRVGGGGVVIHVEGNTPTKQPYPTSLGFHPLVGQ